MSLIIKKAGLQGATDTDVWYAGRGNGTAYISDVLGYTAASSVFAGAGAAMAAGQLFVLCASTDCWISQGSAPVAAKTAGSRFLKAGLEVIVDGAWGAVIAVLADAAAGNASLVRIDA